MGQFIQKRKTSQNFSKISHPPTGAFADVPAEKDETSVTGFYGTIRRICPDGPSQTVKDPKVDEIAGPSWAIAGKAAHLGIQGKGALLGQLF
ncbi:MAG: hypothetical protein OIF40_11735 [Mangrovicoccus sp.]|nr:hypothetical protein [Mangrovicoccus sp.]